MDDKILFVKKRKKGFVAPFINGWNVWEIEEKHWVASVQEAILHAYELGKTHCLAEIDAEIDTELNKISISFRGVQWPKAEEEVELK